MLHCIDPRALTALQTGVFAKPPAHREGIPFGYFVPNVRGRHVVRVTNAWNKVAAPIANRMFDCGMIP
jgi:hypothetical protein